MTTPARQVNVPVAAGDGPALVTKVNRYGVCTDCGQGLGQPHFERCLIAPPDYGRYLSRREISAIVTYAIAIFPLDVVRRSTLRAMLPRGHTKGHPTAQERKHSNKSSVNVISACFGEALRSLDRSGWIERREDCVITLQRDRMLQSATRQLADAPELVTALRASLAGVAAGLPEELTPAGKAQREAELRALRQLMQETPASGPHSGRGYVIVHGARP